MSNQADISTCECYLLVHKGPRPEARTRTYANPARQPQNQFDSLANQLMHINIHISDKVLTGGSKGLN